MKLWPWSRRSKGPDPKEAAAGQAQLDAYWRTRDQRDRIEGRYSVLLEQTAYAPPFELVNPWAQFYDGLKLMFPLFPARFDYRYSQNYIYLTSGQLDLFRAYARYLYETNPYAQGGLNCLADYVIAQGFDYNCVTRRGRTPNKPLEQRCNLFLEDFLNKNEWWKYEREFFIRPKRDGDAFLRFFMQEDGIPQVRAVEPEQVRWPGNDAGPDKDHEMDWSFGILTTREDKVTHLAYRLWYSADNPEGETVPADEMVMFKNHLDRNVKRGISDFFNLQDILDDASKLLRAGRQGEGVRQSIAYIRQWALANQAAVLNLQAANTDYQLPKYNLPNLSQGGSPLENVTTVQPGEVHDVPEGLEMQDPPEGNALNMKIALDSTLRCAAVKWRCPAWVLTGDVEANFAGALVGESPFTKMLEWTQFLKIKEYTLVCERALEYGARAGFLPPNVLDLVCVQAEGQPVAARDLQQETEINETLVQNGIMSRRTWAAREGLDYDEEQRNIEEEGVLLLADPSADIHNRTPEESPRESPTSRTAASGSPAPSSSPPAHYSRLTQRNGHAN